jgi:hypothetical protein
VSLIAYFDESGTHWGGPNACDVFVLCGYIAPEDVWLNSFCPQWKALLNRFELPDEPYPRYFHASVVESGNYPFNRLDENQLNDLKMSAVNLTVNSGIIGIGGGISVSAYKRMLKQYIDDEKVHADPYVFMFSDVIVECVEKSAMFLGEDPNQQIRFVFAHHPRWSIEAEKMYLLLQNDNDWPRSVRLGMASFEDPKIIAPLQAADHIAFETYHYMNDNAPPRPAMNRFLSWPQNHGRHYNEAGLRSFIDICKLGGKF